MRGALEAISDHPVFIDNDANGGGSSRRNRIRARHRDRQLLLTSLANGLSGRQPCHRWHLPAGEAPAGSAAKFSWLPVLFTTVSSLAARSRSARCSRSSSSSITPEVERYHVAHSG